MDGKFGHTFIDHTSSSAALVHFGSSVSDLRPPSAPTPASSHTSVMPERVRAGSATVFIAQISATISEIIVGSIIIAWTEEPQTVQ